MLRSLGSHGMLLYARGAVTLQPSYLHRDDPRQALFCVRADYVPLAPPDQPWVDATQRHQLQQQQQVAGGAGLGDGGDDYATEGVDMEGGADASGGGGGIAALLVLNYANRGRVNGPRVASPGTGAPVGSSLTPQQLVAVPNPAAANTPFANSQLLPSRQPGYDWAIVSGGPPEFVSPNGGCLTQAPAPQPIGHAAANYPVDPLNPATGAVADANPVSNFLARLSAHHQRAAALATRAASGSSGLWLLSRRPVQPAWEREMRAVAARLGFDTSALLPVEQRGCRYRGAGSGGGNATAAAPPAAPPPAAAPPRARP
ncbi:hypothetical protein TSOC_008822 [Tetrabaena socialis]|uniref:Uncharacterized protein n=1 Tax=Tetrabaena socialis TaxID=47790 RepID=A0A2J7ZXI6_9CHLO|nr:hypothetical protein TSOC_008822 [Tetrabaena socialis]|eukprot:PNH04966.1 hypothetical protein TSOC_008822 [Tetrabaena socialis]